MCERERERHGPDTDTDPIDRSTYRASPDLPTPKFRTTLPVDSLEVCTAETASRSLSVVTVSSGDAVVVWSLSEEARRMVRAKATLPGRATGVKAQAEAIKRKRDKTRMVEIEVGRYVGRKGSTNKEESERRRVNEGEGSKFNRE